MGNMSYCRFENTYNDLRDCKNALDMDGIHETYQEASEYERRHIEKLVLMCKDIADSYADDVFDGLEVEEEEEEEEF